jgi:hypothetical protein
LIIPIKQAEFWLGGRARSRISDIGKKQVFTDLKPIQDTPLALQ